MPRHFASGSAAAALLLVIGSILYWPTVTALAVRWIDPINTTYSHGYLVVVVSLWLLWRERDAFNAPQTIGQSRLWGAALLIVLGGLWLLAYRLAIEIVCVLLLPPLLWAALLLVFGWHAARRAAFPLGYLYFAIPIWTAVNPAAQWGTVLAVRAALRLVGIPAHFDGNNVTIPEGTFVIEDGCSGLHFLVVALALGALLGELQRDGWRTRVKILVLAMALGLLTNWIRVFCVIIAGHLTHMQHYLVRVDHRYFGWLLFALALPVFLSVSRRLSRSAPRRSGEAVAALRPRYGGFRLRSAAPSFLLAVTLLALPPVWNKLIRPGSMAGGKGSVQPAMHTGWAGPEVPQGDWQPVFRNADAVVMAAYAKTGAKVESFEAIYLEQRQGRELGGFGNAVAGTARVLERGRTRSNGIEYNVERISGRASDDALVWYGYDVDGQWFTQAGDARVAYARAAISRLKSPVSRVVAYSSPCVPDCATATQALQDFVLTEKQE